MENKNKYIIEENLPGYKKEDIKIEINKKERLLEISAKTSEKIEEEKIEKKGDVKVYIYEKKAKSFYKAISIPENIYLNKLSTSYKDNKLKIEFDKKR